ncbi:reverse transcriptase domain-containing protein [Tanacetum coccineum]
MHTRASNSELVEPLLKPEHPLNRRLRRRNRRFPFEQRNEPPAQPKIVYALILDINYLCHFLHILENYNLMDDEPMWAADRVVAPTLGSAITIPETTNKFTIKGSSNSDTDKIMTITRFMLPPPATTFLAFHPHDNNIIAIGMEDSSIQIYGVQVDEVKMKMDAQYKEFQSRSKQPNPDHNDDDKPILADKQSARPFGSLPSNTQPNPKGSSSKPYQPLQAQNEHVNAVFTEDEDEESTPQPKSQTPKPVKETLIPKPYKPKIPYPQRLRKEKIEAQYDSIDLIGATRNTTHLCLFCFSLRDQAINWLDRLPAGSISTWDDLTTHILAWFFPPRRTAKL